MFVYFDGSDNRYDRMDNTDGKLDVVYDKDGYREFLKYVNMLVSEKLLDMASFTQDTATMRKALQADVQTVGMMCGSANGFGNNIASWQPIEQPKGPDRIAAGNLLAAEHRLCMDNFGRLQESRGCG